MAKLYTTMGQTGANGAPILSEQSSTSVPHTVPTPYPNIPMTSKLRPRPGASLVASAQRLTGKTVKRHTGGAKSWQEDAWEMYDLVGEERFLATTLAGRIAQARLFIGRSPANETEDPIPVTDNPAITDILNYIGGSAIGRAQMMLRLAVNLFVAGEGWVVGIPRFMLPESQRPPTSLIDRTTGTLAAPPGGYSPSASLDVADLDWRTLSVSEITMTTSNQLKIVLGESPEEVIECDPLDVFLIRVWRPHPRRYWQADSPTRSSLPVLRELVGLTMHISAQVDSRLAGAGMLIVPESAQRALKAKAGLDPNVDGDDDSDPFTEALMEAMIRPIEDRSSASALVPLVVTVPDDATGLFQYLTFAKPLDTEARNLRDEAIRRLALGQDAPPELLLGTGGMNHWGAWLVQEEVVTTHIEPPLALICDALTVQYLWPVLIDSGMTEEEAQTYLIWFDVNHMVLRPNRSTDAYKLHERGVLSDHALRDASGFDETDAPLSFALSQAVRLGLEMSRQYPSLMIGPGLPDLVRQIATVLDPSFDPATAEPMLRNQGPGGKGAALPETPVPGDPTPSTAPAPANGTGPTRSPPGAIGPPGTRQDAAPNGPTQGTGPPGLSASGTIYTGDPLFPTRALIPNLYGGKGSGRYPQGSGGDRGIDGNGVNVANTGPSINDNVTAALISRSRSSAPGATSLYDGNASVTNRLGRCYEMAGKFALDNPGSVLVHGTIQGEGYPPLDHAWVETPRQTIFEPTSGNEMTPQEFSTFFSPKVNQRYTTAQQNDVFLKYEHWGPYASESGASAPGVDASWSLAAHIGPNGKLTPERLALHESIINAALAGVVPNATGIPTVTFMGGGPASGKSTLLSMPRAGILAGKLAVQVSADDIKLKLPEMGIRMAAGDSMAAAYVHEESSLISHQLRDRATKAHLDIVLDGTGDTSIKAMKSKIYNAKKEGYSVKGVYVTVPVNLAVERATKRGIESGRFVPEAAIRAQHKSVSQVFPQIMGLMDSTSLYDTSGAQGSTPTLVVESIAGKTAIKDKVLWNSFLAKG